MRAASLPSRHLLAPHFRWRGLPQRREVYRAPRSLAVVQASQFDERPTEPITPEQQQISKELMESMEASIQEALEADKVVVRDVYGDYQHVAIEVVAAKFEGLNAVKRQRLVYQVRTRLITCRTWQLLVSVRLDTLVSHTSASAGPHPCHAAGDLEGTTEHRACCG
jgi:stress-induced morphogen